MSHDCKLIISAGWDKIINIWRANPNHNCKLLRKLFGHTDKISSIAIRRLFTDRFIISGSGDSTIRIWDLLTGIMPFDPLDEHKTWILSVTLSFDEKYVTSGSTD